MSSYMFETEQARFTVQQGSGQYIAARDLGDAFVGRGLYREFFRDFSWAYIEGIVHENGKVKVVYLDTVDVKEPDDKVRGVVRDITLTQVIKVAARFDAGDQILVSSQPVTRPKNRRRGRITTIVDEVLEDSELPLIGQ